MSPAQSAAFNSTSVTPEQIAAVLDYSPMTGVFIWRVSQGRAPAGTKAGVVKNNGYRRITWRRRFFYEHRLAWLLTYGAWPTGHIDHINGDRADNRIANLRDVSQSQNVANSLLSAANKSGIKGVYWDRERKKWAAQIKVKYKCLHLGRFDRIEGDARVYVDSSFT